MFPILDHVKMIKIKIMFGRMFECEFEPQLDQLREKTQRKFWELTENCFAFLCF